MKSFTKFSLIVLSNTTHQSNFKMNLDCFNSFIKSAVKIKISYEIILVESNKLSKWNYSIEHFKIIKPTDTFNFHKFLNIGIKEAMGDYYILSNNDVVFSKNWLFELLKIIKLKPDIKSFSPYDILSNKLDKKVVLNNDYVCGYEIQKHITGWCIITHKSVFNTIKKLDETFDFYYADFDYALQLQKFNIKHALITKAEVRHLENKSHEPIKQIDLINLNPKTPEYIIKENWTWVLEDEKMIDGLIQFHEKWGNRKIIKLKLLILSKLEKVGLGYFNRFIL